MSTSTATIPQDLQVILDKFNVQPESEEEVKATNDTLAFAHNVPYYLRCFFAGMAIIGVILGVVVAIVAIVGWFVAWPRTPSMALLACFLGAPGVLVGLVVCICDNYNVGAKKCWHYDESVAMNAPKNIMALNDALEHRTLPYYLRGTRERCLLLLIGLGSSGDELSSKICVARWQSPN